MRKIKIISCSSNNWWYQHLVGNIISIEDKEFKDDYIASNKHKRNENDELINTGMLLKTDCEIIH